MFTRKKEQETHTHYYQQEVEITDGFYSAHTGRIVDFVRNQGNIEYVVELADGRKVQCNPKYLEGQY